MNISQDLAQQRCYNHASREAVARCLECHRFFCRECVSEHDDRLICANCLAKFVKPSLTKRYHLAEIFKIVPLLLSFSVLWWCFYLLGQILLAIPATFHEGALW